MGRTVVALIVSLWMIPVSILVNRIVPHSYMDEIFHIPQVQQYCKGNFRSWDPMITTPPGLYYLSLAHIASLFPGMIWVQRISSFSDLCSTAILRSVNGALAIVCSILIYEIITQLKPALDRRKAALNTKNYFLSALMGALAVCIRQTNIIWMLFVACDGVIDMLLVNRQSVGIQKSDISIAEKNRISPKDNFSAKPGVRRRKMKGTQDVPFPTVTGGNEATLSGSHLSGLFDEFQYIIIQAWHLKWELMVSFTPFILVLGAFVSFVYWNGSVVLGAKEAHAVSPHFAQTMYFAMVSALFSAPFHFTLGHATALLRSFFKIRPLSFFLGFVILTAGVLSVHFFSIAHPYLLADNRHYPFYIWRKVINAHQLMKYFLVPFYVYSWLSILHILGKARSRIWVLAYFLACAAVLVPTPLVEFRYYTIPFFIFMLNSGIEEISKWLLIAILYVVVNSFTMYMFLFRSFEWSHESGVQRFIW
ncbi:dol-P-Glc:Glc(2)Man(9)GlcNAc(2)-PP-Dol alpha-1,2-glucosyltransferase isoform X2 [Spinacia oleracea]|uniref:Dol-P-Glc:Glc(2)Man(9)GlcNAc(2)-PP-Dol alpha-1,2-glucosyltransferase n=1 Tax=Spinacia oleracea TaxID=3562 RepID=A0A9R0HS20_SPIOL|nr:dol-P-Glc:Glc(2)Man(9)GlcNAc(2)-PP-Dol alpha-1,2-glucosyltransferase isoform X2 [Spinacia oleracea]